MWRPKPLVVFLVVFVGSSISLTCAHVFYNNEISNKLLKLTDLFSNKSSISTPAQRDYHDTLWQFKQCAAPLRLHCDINIILTHFHKVLSVPLFFDLLWNSPTEGRFVKFSHFCSVHFFASILDFTLPDHLVFLYSLLLLWIIVLEYHGNRRGPAYSQNSWEPIFLEGEASSKPW